jgi:DNA-binding NtrC family response regulator
MIKKLSRLLVVDDEIDILNPLCDLLSEWGYEVKGLTSGKEALEELKKQDFDLLLTDLVMPEIDGIALIKAAMKIDPLLVCIIITGKGTIQTAVEAMKIGAFDYLTKPLEWKLLRPIITRAIETRRLRESEKKYRSIVEDQTELVSRFLPDKTLTFVNEAICRYFSKKPEELI